MTQSLIAFAAIHAASLVIILVLAARETKRPRRRAEAASESGIALEATPVAAGRHAPQFVARHGAATALWHGATASGRRSSTKKKGAQWSREPARATRMA